MGHVHEIDVQLDDIVEAGPGRFERRLDILEDLPGLGAEITRPDEIAHGVEGDLSGNVNHPRVRDSDDMRIARRRRQRRRIEKAHVVRVHDMSSRALPLTPPVDGVSSAYCWRDSGPSCSSIT